MRKTLLAIAVTSALAAALPSLAVAADAPAASEHTLTGNVGLFSSYRFRGIDQTFGKPAIQGGIDYSHASGFYAGNWNSNVSSGAGYPEGNLEMDFYGGYKFNVGDLGFDLGAIYYYYPGTNANFTNNGKTHTGKVDNKEVYIGATWNVLSAKYYYSVGDYFSTPDSKGSTYLDLAANFDLGEGWGVNAHVGHVKAKNIVNGSYTDYKLGVTKDLGNNWSAAASYIATNAKGDCGKGEFYCLSNSWNSSGLGSSFKDGGRNTVVVSVSRTF